MAGVSPAPPPLSESTVVVIDAQREYTDGKLPLTNVQPALAEIGKLLRRARALQIPVIHIVHQGKPGGAFGPDTPGFEVASPATPAPGEAVVSKSLPNAFASTDLASRLAALKKPNVVLVGFMTHLCVEATARASIDLGFKATVIASATATRPLPDPSVARRSARRKCSATHSRRWRIGSPPWRRRWMPCPTDYSAASRASASGS
jgi:nicotinamidase-related amidase